MTETMEWLQNNWIDLARLGVQCAILAAVVRYGRTLLGTLRASQEQVGALLRLSVSDPVAERGGAAPEPGPERYFERASAVVPVCPEPVEEREPVFAGAYSRGGYGAEREQSLGGRVAGAQASGFSAGRREVENLSSSAATSPSLTPWVSAPGNEFESLTAPAASVPVVRGVSTWLKAPIRNNGVSPLRKMLRWLQAPAGR